MTNQLKIEIGDTVRISDTSQYYGCGSTNPMCEGVYNKTAGVTSLSHRVDWANGVSDWYNLDDLTLIKKGKTMQFTKSDLKTGMVVRYRDGEYRILIDKVLTGIGGFNVLSLYNDSLLGVNASNVDIVAVYNMCNARPIDIYLKGEHLTLIWERTEQTPAQKEMEVLQSQIDKGAAYMAELHEQAKRLQAKL
jgi:hypothetical protein